LTALAAAGLGYPAILLENFPYDAPQFILNLVCALGLASLICLLVFTGLGMIYRNQLNQRREESRLLVTKLLASRLGQPIATPLQNTRDNRVGDGDDKTVRVANGSMVLQ
jgi:Tfp pilus assembly protein PilN